MSKYQININNISLGGFAPAFYKETYPSYGNLNHAGAMLNCDLTNPGYIQQGPGLLNMSATSGSVTTLVKGITDYAVATDIGYGTGGNQIYKIEPTTNTPVNTIDKADVTGELGEDVALYQGALYYTYNHSGSAGDVGKYDLSSTWDDDWGSTVPSGKAALASAPHQMCVELNDSLYIANGRYIAEWDGTTFMPQQLDLPTGTIVQSIVWSSDRL